MENQEVPRLFDKAVILTVRMGLPGTTKKVRKSQVATEGNGHSAPVVVKADIEAVKVSKVILDCIELKAIQKKHTEIKTWIDTHTSHSYFRGGLFWLSLDLIEEAEAQFEKYDLELEPLIQGFLNVYPERAAEARTRQGEPILTVKMTALSNSLGTSWFSIISSLVIVESSVKGVHSISGLDHVRVC